MIGSLLVGAFIGSVGTYFLSQKTRENIVVAKHATQDFLDNEEVRRIFIEAEINRLVAEGKLLKLAGFTTYETHPLDYTHFPNYKFWVDWCARNGYPYVEPETPTRTVNVPIIDAAPAAT